MSKPQSNPRVVITGDVRLAFPSVFKKRPRPGDDGKESYQCTLLFPPDYDLTPLKKAMKAAVIKKFGDKPVKLAPDRIGLRDATEKDWDGFDEGWHYVSINVDDKPVVVDRRNAPVTDESLVYGGMWVRAYLAAFAYDKGGKKGVGFALNALQLVRDGERFDGRLSVEEAFEALEDDDTALSGGGDEEEDDTPPAKPAKKPKRQPVEDDEEEVEDDEDDTPPAKPAKKPKRSSDDEWDPLA